MLRLPFVMALCLIAAGPLFAGQVPGFDRMAALKQDLIARNHWKLTGTVEAERGDMKFYAEEIEVFTDTDQLVATGHVVFTSGGHRIAADRLEFDMATRTGTFFNATGTAALGDAGPRDQFGTQEAEAYFYGATIEKLGPRRYRITRGGFTTCAQPTPRWEIVSGSVTLNLDDYALLRHSVFRVKGVPLLYLPLLYYPLQEDDRATGFLIPSYGVSTVRGQSISNAFFWAIDRSQDATIFHDWFSNTGQGVGAEYRYVLGPGSEGSARTYLLNEREASVPVPGGTAFQPARRSYEIRGGGTQTLGRRLRARAHVDYFSDLTVQQLYHQDVFQASNRRRTWGANLTGSRGAYTISGTVDRSETFTGEHHSAVRGSLPRVTVSRSERPLAGPLYFSLNGEYAGLIQSGRTQDRVVDEGLSRFDVSPLIRVPFTRWPFLTVNSSAAWRGTYWTESYDPIERVRLDEGVTRQYVDLQSRITGPSFTRIFDTPGRRYASRFKHVIEPTVTLQRTTAVDTFDRIIRLEGGDSIVGGTTTVTYGLSNRLYAKRGEGPTAPAREIVTVSLDQRYYSDSRASQYDRHFRTSFGLVPPTNFSPLALTARLTPTDGVNAQVLAEYDTQFKALRTIGVNGQFRLQHWLQAAGGWNQRRFIEGLPGFNDPDRLDHYLNASATLRGRDNRLGGSYSFNYDLLRERFLQQRIIGYYNAQCCGVAVEYQTFNFQGIGAARVPQDRRFNLSFTLAGIGTFSNFFGALGGSDRP